MTHDLHTELERWLAAEACQEPEQAEAALRRVFLRMPEARVSSGFAQRVLVGAGVIPRPANDFFVRPVFRWAFAAIFLGVGMVLSWLSTAASSAGPRLRAGQVIDLFQTAVAAVAKAMGGTIGLLEDWLALPQMVAQAVSSPVFLVSLVLLTVVSLTTFRWLTDLTFRRIGAVYADVA